ncbi:MAG: S-layer homology domain-containing protein, partial [Clostridia bacterium]|nr:S-layer homology domain-containing protein [Clostridia bacterium]
PYSDWAKSDIEKAIALNIINVGGNYNFPAPITREEFCELIYNYCYNVVKEVDTVTGENKFTDTTNSKIIRLNAMGIINGKSETEFAPNDLLTREEAAVILNRMVNKTIPVPVTEMYFNFDDEASISDWASDSIQVMCNMGVMNGVGENKFAPQDTYTTEQAIVTIVRVYAAQSANMGIIGGADAPTEIYIGEDIEVSDFYIEEAFKHTKKAGELAGTKEFISMYISDDETKTSIDNLSKTDFEKPVQMYYVSYNIDKVVEYYNKMIAEENPDEEIDVKKFIELNGFNLSVFATQINGRFGARTLAATTVLTSREGYIMPKDFENDFGIYLQYEGDYSALVTFNKIGEGVIEARMQFVRNGEKADMLMFMSEIYDALGEESITIGKIK